MHPHITDQLTNTLRRAAVEFCRDHDIPADQASRFTDAFMVAALNTMRWQNEQNTLNTVAIAEAIDCQPCIRQVTGSLVEPWRGELPRAPLSKPSASPTLQPAEARP